MLDAYVSASGVRRVLAPRSGLLGALGVLLIGPDLAGTAISVSAVPGGARVHGPQRARPGAGPPRGAPAAQLQPTLASALPAGSSLLLDVRGLARAARRVLSAGGRGRDRGRASARCFSASATALTAEGVNVPQVLALLFGARPRAVAPVTAAPAARW